MQVGNIAKGIFHLQVHGMDFPVAEVDQALAAGRMIHGSAKALEVEKLLEIGASACLCSVIKMGIDAPGKIIADIIHLKTNDGLLVVIQSSLVDTVAVGGPRFGVKGGNGETDPGAAR